MIIAKPKYKKIKLIFMLEYNERKTSGVINIAVMRENNIEFWYMSFLNSFIPENNDTIKFDKYLKILIPIKNSKIIKINFNGFIELLIIWYRYNTITDSTETDIKYSTSNIKTRFEKITFFSFSIFFEAYLNITDSNSWFKYFL